VGNASADYPHDSSEMQDCSQLSRAFSQFEWNKRFSSLWFLQWI